MKYTLYMKFKFDDSAEDEYDYYSQEIESDLPGFNRIENCIFAWKESELGLKIIKDDFGSCVRDATEQEIKEFVWIKLRSEPL